MNFIDFILNEQNQEFWDYENGKVQKKPQNKEVSPRISSAANIEQQSPVTPQTTQNMEKFIDDMKTQKSKIKKSIANKKYYEAHKRPKKQVAIFGESFVCYGASRKAEIVKFILKNAQKDGKFTLKQKEVRETLKVARQTITDTYKLLKTIKFWRKESEIWVIDKKFLPL